MSKRNLPLTESRQRPPAFLLNFDIEMIGFPIGRPTPWTAQNMIRDPKPAKILIMSLFKKLDLLLSLLLLVFSLIIMAKMPKIQNLDSPIYFNQITNRQIPSVTWNFGDSATAPENINTAISPRPVFMLGESLAVSPQVTKIQTASSNYSISVEFPTPLTASTVDGLLICEAVRGPGTDAFMDTLVSKFNALEQVPQENYKNYKP